jgi:hypothetical protein
MASSESPTQRRRIVTGHRGGKAVVLSDTPLATYAFKTIRGFEHAWSLPNIALRLRVMHQKQSWFSIPTRVMLSFSNTQRISRPKCFSFWHRQRRISENLHARWQ